MFAETLIPLDAEWRSERHRLDFILTTTNPEEAFR